MGRKQRRANTRSVVGAEGPGLTVTAGGSAAWQPWVWGGILVLVTLAAYWPTLQGQWIWDDGRWLLEPDVVREWRGLWYIWTQPAYTPHYYPLVFTTFWTEHKLWGFAPTGYHAVNIGLHAGSAVLLWRVLHRLGLKGAWLAALLWAIHPVQVESVAWVAERKNTLSGVLFFAALWAYLRFEGIGEASEQEARREWKWYGLAAGCLGLALLAKTVTVVLPALVVVILWWKRGRLPWRNVWPTAPLVVVGLGLAVLTIVLEHGKAGTHGPEFALSPVERVIIAGRVAWFYPEKVFWPWPLVQVYPKWVLDAGAWRQWGYAVGAVMAAGVVGGLARRYRSWRGIAAGLAGYVVIISPALGFISFYTMLYTYVADHYQYLACGAILALTVEVVWRGLEQAGAWTRESRVSRWARVGLGTTVVLGLFSLTWGYGSLYQDPEALWAYNLNVNPRSWIVLNNLGDARRQKGDLNGAMEAYQASLVLRPEEWRTWRAIGDTYVVAHKMDDATRCYQHAVKLMPPEVLESWRQAAGTRPGS